MGGFGNTISYFGNRGNANNKKGDILTNNAENDSALYARNDQDQSPNKIVLQNDITVNNNHNGKSLIRKIKDSISSLTKNKALLELDENVFNNKEKRLSEQVNEYFNSIGNVVYREGFGNIVLNKKGIKSSISHGISRAKGIAFSAVPDVIKNGVQIDYEQNWKERGYDTYVFAGKVKLGDKDSYVGVVVKKSKNDNQFYLHEILDEDGNIIKIKQDDANSFKTVPEIKNDSHRESASSANEPLAWNSEENSTVNPINAAGSVDNNIPQNDIVVNNSNMQEGGENIQTGEEVTPHQSTEPTASPQGEAFGARDAVESAKERIKNAKNAIRLEKLLEARYGAKFKHYYAEDGTKGFYENGVSYINDFYAQDMFSTSVHEFLHQYKDIDGEGYSILKKAIENDLSITKYNEYKNEVINDLKNEGIEYDENKIDDLVIEEAISDIAMEIFKNPNSIDSVMKRFNNDLNVIEKLLEFIRGIANKIKSFIAEGDFEADDSIRSIVNNFNQIEDVFNAVLASGAKANGNVDNNNNGDVKYKIGRNVDDTFPPYNESQSDANERATRWAHNEDVEEGARKLASYRGSMYLIEKDSSKDMKYKIVKRVTKSEYDKWKERRKKYGEDIREQSGRVQISAIDEKNRRNDFNRGVELGVDRDDYRHNREAGSVGELDSDQGERGRTSDQRNRIDERGFENRQNGIESKKKYRLAKKGERKGDGSQFRATWTIENGVLTDKELASFYSKISELHNNKYKNYKLSWNGEYIFSIKNKLIYSDGDYDFPSIKSVITFLTADEDLIDYAREIFYDGEAYKRKFEISKEIVEAVLGEETIKRTNSDFSKTDKGSKDNNRKRENGKTVDRGIREELVSNENKRYRLAKDKERVPRKKKISDALERYKETGDSFALPKPSYVTSFKRDIERSLEHYEEMLYLEKEALSTSRSKEEEARIRKSLENLSYKISDKQNSKKFTKMYIDIFNQCVIICVVKIFSLGDVNNADFRYEFRKIKSVSGSKSTPR